MADIGIERKQLVVPTNEVEEMWLKVRIQEKVSAIVRYKQDIEDLQKGRILDLSARIKMCELEIKHFEERLMKLRSIDSGEQK